MKLNNTRARSLAETSRHLFSVCAECVVCVHVPLVDERESGFQKLSTAFVYLLHLRREFYVIPSLSAKRSLSHRNAIF
jgi:hypothetical protein